MSVRNEVKSYLMREGVTMQEVLKKLSKQYGWSNSISNLSCKLRRETLRYKEKTGGGNPANDKAPSIKLGAKAKTKYENIVDVVERLLIACKQNGIKIVSVKDMKLEESGTFLARYYEPESETLEYADGFVYKSKKYV